MFITTKRKKIANYLDSRCKNGGLSAFDDLLSDYLSGRLITELSSFRLSKINVYIDWLDDYRCINITGRYYQYYIDIQVEQNSFSVCWDEDEPDESTDFTLNSEKNFYKILKDILTRL